VSWLRKLRTILLFAALGNPFSFVLSMMLIASMLGVTSLSTRAIWSMIGAFVAWAGLVTAGLVLAPMLSLPRVLLARYERRKVRLATHKIDAGIRELAAGNLSVPESDEEGKISLASRS
jgi:hypothetical protein